MPFHHLAKGTSARYGLYQIPQDISTELLNRKCGILPPVEHSIAYPGRLIAAPIRWMWPEHITAALVSRNGRYIHIDDTGQAINLTFE